MRRTPDHVTGWRFEQLAAGIAAGETTTKLAERVGLSQTRVSQLIRLNPALHTAYKARPARRATLTEAKQTDRARVEARKAERVRLKAERNALVGAMLAEGRTYGEIAREIGRSVAAVYAIVNGDPELFAIKERSPTVRVRSRAEVTPGPTATEPRRLAQFERIALGLARGETQSEIAEALGVTRQRVSQAVAGSEALREVRRLRGMVP